MEPRCVDRVLHVEVSSGVARLTLDSPANRNALSRAMRAQLRQALTEAFADDAVRVVVLDHTGRVFCSAGARTSDSRVPVCFCTVWQVQGSKQHSSGPRCSEILVRPGTQ